MQNRDNYITWESALFMARRMAYRGDAVNLASLPEIVRDAARYLVAVGEIDGKEVFCT